MTPDQDHAVVLRRFADGAVVDQPVMLAAIERAIVLLETSAEREFNAKGRAR